MLLRIEEDDILHTTGGYRAFRCTDHQLHHRFRGLAIQPPLRPLCVFRLNVAMQDPIIITPLHAFESVLICRDPSTMYLYPQHPGPKQSRMVQKSPQLVSALLCLCLFAIPHLDLTLRMPAYQTKRLERNTFVRAGTPEFSHRGKLENGSAFDLLFFGRRLFKLRESWFDIPA